MTSTQHASVARAPGTTTDNDDGRPWRHARLLVHLAMAVSVVPLWVAAIRDGRRGWVPTLDVASTVLRAHDVFSAHPPLVGMWSAGSSWSGHQIHFPGAIQLYLLAAPVHLLGNTWGPLIGMAAINSAWILIAGWLLARRLGTAEALLGIGFLTMLVWSVGSELLVDATPMNMVAIPFALFLIAVWCVADGELVAIPVLVGIANYLLLCHLVLTFLVPVIGLCAPIGLVLWYREQRRRTPGSLPATRRLLRRQFGISAAITLVMWLPSVVQQITTSPGNLNLLLASSGSQRKTMGDTGEAVQVMIDMVARPPFWLRGTMRQPSFSRSGGALSVERGLGAISLVLAILLVIGFVALLVAVARRQDRTSVTALAIAMVVFVANIQNVRMAPNPWGFPVQYLRSLWPSAMFVWLAVAFALLRLLRASDRRIAVWPLAAGTVVFALLALPAADYRSGMAHAKVPAARAMRSTVVPALRSGGLPMLRVGPDFASQSYGAALALDLATAGIPFCVTRSASQQYGKHRDCGTEAEVTVTVTVVPNQREARPGQIVAISLLPPDERHELLTLQQRLEASLARRQRLTYDPLVERVLRASYSPERFAAMTAKVAPADGDLHGFLDDLDVRQIIVAGTRTRNGRLVSPIRGTGLSPADLLRWAKLEGTGRLVVTVSPAR